jgi:hypothetical protein
MNYIRFGAQRYGILSTYTPGLHPMCGMLYFINETRTPGKERNARFALITNQNSDMSFSVYIGVILLKDVKKNDELLVVYNDDNFYT